MWPRATSASIRADQSSSMGYMRWMYGPAQKQPLRAWIPNMSLRTATTKFECSNPRECRRPSETIASRSGSGSPRISMWGFLPQESSAHEVLLPPTDRLGSHGFLQREHESGSNRLDDRRGASLLADRRVRMIGLPRRAHEQDRPAAGYRGDANAEERPLRDQNAGGSGAADELVRRQEDSVRVGQVPVPRARRRVHVYREVGAGRRVVPAGERTVTMEDGRDPLDVRDDPGHVRGGREAPDLQGPSSVAKEFLLEVPQVDSAAGVLANRHDIRDRLPPGQLVRVVLVRADEDDRPLRRRQVEEPHELVDRAGRPRAAEENDVVVAPVHGTVNDPTGVLP